jgi:aspartyl-tRNA(Asn)/glutamyl-tRNA(Gln) amidotransferase subunit A
MPFNLTGHPAITVPCGFASDGLPIGMQIVGRLRCEADLLAAAAVFEMSRGLLSRWPDVEMN